MKMTNLELVEKLKKVVSNHKTLYVMGCFGAPLTGANVNRYLTNHSYNKAADRTAMIKAAANQNPPVFGFDCVCLIKGILWGWDGTASATYGGAKYAVNGVPDIGADQMITKCSGLSTDFSKIEIGEAVWVTGHIGIYIGNGLAIECTPRWDNKVQITAVLNIGAKSGYNGRQWTKHGKLPYITYEAAKDTTAPSTSPSPTGFKVGDLVQFKGGKVYTSANAAKAATTKPESKCKVTQVYNGKHPYHLISQDGKGVYGWVDAADTAASGSAIQTPTPTTQQPTGGESDPSMTIWNFLKGKGLNDFAVAGLMGNLYAESGLKASNLQNTYEQKLGMTDAQYTAAVDSGQYTNFVKDSAGYGLAQWTYWSRKQALLDFAKAAKASIGDLQMQLNFLWKELQGYASVMNTLKNATSILQASNAVLTGYERPADQSTAAQQKRAGFGQTYFEKYTSKSGTVQQPTIKVGGKVKVLKAETYTGGTFKTYYDTYDVLQVNGDRIVIGIGKTVTAAVKASNLQAV